MPSLSAKTVSYVSKHWLLVLGILFFSITAAGLVMMMVLASKQAARNEERFKFNEAIESSTKNQVKRIELTIEEDGQIKVIEILLNGQINIYDQYGNLIKSGLKGFYDISTLFEKIETNWGDFAKEYGGNGKFTLVIETNQGTTTIEGEGSGDGDGGGIIDDIEDTGDEILNPTPTPTPQPTIAPGSPTPSPAPSGGGTPSPTQSPTPSPAPSGGGSPSPLPGYYTAPPFTCEAYQGTRPKIISNIICGLGL